VLLNRELVDTAGGWDAELLGDCDDAVQALCAELGWADDLQRLMAAVGKGRSGGAGDGRGAGCCGGDDGPSCNGCSML
jgi:hypothetical protein